jgi:hypothetical protein
MGLADIPCNPGSIPGLSPDTTYFIYYNDPGFAGDTNGALVYHATTVKEEALAGAGRFYVGSIRTPVPGAAIGTVGNNDGGAGAQSGMTNIIAFSSVAVGTASGGVSVSNAQNMVDGDVTTFASFVQSGSSGSVFVTLSDAPAMGRRFISANLNILMSVPVNTATPGGAQLWTATVNLQGSATATIVVSAGPGPLPQGVQPPTTRVVSIPVSNVISNKTNVVLGFGSIGVTGGNAQINVYEVWIEAIE